MRCHKIIPILWASFCLLVHSIDVDIYSFADCVLLDFDQLEIKRQNETEAVVIHPTDPNDWDEAHWVKCLYFLNITTEFWMGDGTHLKSTGFEDIRQEIIDNRGILYERPDPILQALENIYVSVFDWNVPLIFQLKSLPLTHYLTGFKAKSR